MLSLNNRALIAGSLIIAAFFALAGFSLQKAFDRHARAAMAQRLLGQVYVLIAASRRDDNGVVSMPDAWQNEKFLMVSPRFVAEIQHGDGFVWQSPAIKELNLSRQLAEHRNQYRFALQQTEGGDYGVLSYAVAWGEPGDQDFYHFRVAEDLTRYQRERGEFTTTLWISLAAVALVLLLVQRQMLRWELAPMRQAQLEIEQIERGERERLGEEYPGELRTLTGNINRLLVQQQEHIARYRHSLGDLAHSLKTPLSILQNAVSSQQEAASLRKLLQDQLSRINEIASYQLNRAATAGSGSLQKAIDIAALAAKVISGMKKVYALKHFDIETDIPDELQFALEEGDFLEILGNLLDNACKHCQSQVWVKMALDSVGLSIRISDDGTGFTAALIDRGPVRGERGDNSLPGHGLGLAMVHDIVQAYAGKMDLGNTEQGGAWVAIQLPASARI